MSSRHIDGTLIVAKLQRRTFAGASYRDVTVRRSDGSVENFGTVAVSRALRDAIIPGVRGRFYFHDVLGAKGLHGFRSSDGSALVDFPRFSIILFAVVAVMNVSVYAFLHASPDGSRPVLLFFGLLSAAMSAAYYLSRRAMVRAFREDDEDETILCAAGSAISS